MSPLRHATPWLVCALLAWQAAPAGAQATPDPLRLVPAQADLVFKVDDPRRLHDVVLAQDAVKQLLQLDAAREFYDSTNFRRFYQLLSYFEGKLGGQYPELLDRLAGGGAVVALNFAENDPPVLFVIQSKDEKTLRSAVTLGLEMIEGELARQESKDKAEKGKYRDVEAVKLGKDFHVALAGSALLASNNEKALRAAIDLYRDGDAKSFARGEGWQAARKLLAKERLFDLWVNLAKARESAQFKVVFDTFTSEPATALFVGGMGDVARRAPFLSLAASHAPDGFALDLRFPRGREGMGDAARVMLPDAGQVPLPLLTPKNVQASVSYHLDLVKIWENRSKLLNREALKGVEDLEKNSAIFLGGTKLSQLLAQTGPRQRLVYTQQDSSGVYKTAPKQRIGAFAVVQEVRDPKFGKSMEFILRSVAIFGAFQFKLKLAEEEYEGVKLVGYRFPEDGRYKGDPDNVRYNFSPCFGTVGDQFFAASTVELGRELVTLLRKEASAQPGSGGVVTRARLYSSGLGAQLKGSQDDLVTGAVLGQALTPEAAQRQAEAIIRLVEGLGTLDAETHYGASDTWLNLRARLKK